MNEHKSHLLLENFQLSFVFIQIANEKITEILLQSGIKVGANDDEEGIALAGAAFNSKIF